MSQVQFTHLHTHSPEGSLLDGFMRIEKAIAKVKANGMDALGISDHGTMAAHYKFNKLCREEGIHPVFGMEAYITYDKTFKKENFEHIDIVQDEEGNYQFKFLKEEEEIRGNWFPANSFSTKKRQNEVERLAKQTYGVELLKAEVGEEDMPTKKPTITRQVNRIFKEYYENGYQLYLQADTSQRDFFSWFPWSGHLLLIARNDEGYQNLLRLNNIANVEGFYRKPRVDYKDIEKYGNGIIATTACRGSSFNQLLLRGKQKEAEEELQRYMKAFDKVYIELQPSRDPDQLFVNQKGQEIAKKYNLPIIVTTDAHMVDKDEEDLHSTMTNIGQGSSNYEEDESDISAYDTAYLMTQEEILSYGIPPEALQNAYDLSHECKVTFLDDISVKYPEYEVPAGYTFDSYLSELAWNGLFDLFLTKDYITDYDTYQERLEYELQIIKDKGLSAYFIIVWDYINWSKEQEIYMSPARGSGGGSLVALALGITYGLDPIKYGLLFEREKVALVKFR